MEGMTDGGMKWVDRAYLVISGGGTEKVTVLQKGKGLNICITRELCNTVLTAVTAWNSLELDINDFIE